MLLLVALGGALGAVVASYVTTTAMRLTDAMAPAGLRSACDGCRRPLRFGEMVPVASYLALRGRCRACDARISPLHPGGELAGLAAGVAIALSAPDWRAAPLGVMAACLLAAAVIDARTRILPDVLVGAVAVAALVMALAHGQGAAIEGVISAAIAGGLLIGLRRGAQALRGEPGLGLGDVKLICGLALWLGVATSWMIFVAAALGIAAFRLRGRGDGRMAFGPMIAAAGLAIGLTMESGLWPRPL